MQIKSYECRMVDPPGWEFDRVDFGTVNLLVGDTATGKTRFLNTLFNLSRVAVAKQLYVGYWNVTIDIGGSLYRWVVDVGRDDDSRPMLLKERLAALDQGQETEIISRHDGQFLFSGDATPKLSQRETGVSLLQEEPLVQPVHKFFSSIIRRRFFGDDLRRSSALQAIHPDLVRRITRKHQVSELRSHELTTNSQAFFLQKLFPDIFATLREQFMSLFPFVTMLDVLDYQDVDAYSGGPVLFPNVQVLCMREAHADVWIPLSEMSSGMQKVLMVLTDILTFPDGGVYLIDEYENSLGISAIDFLPSILPEPTTRMQFIITSHHPYIINNIPVSSWFVFHRKGNVVSIAHGDKLVEKLDKSTQTAFIKLINWPFFRDGVE